MSADLKKPCSSYILFCNDNRASVKTRLGDDVSQKEVQKELAKLWKDVSDETKEKYKKIYQQNKVEYDKKLEAIKAAESDESDDTNKRQLRKRKAKKEESSDDESSKKKKKPTKEAAPRKPNGYQVYMKENKEKLKTDTLTGKKLTEKVQKMWKDLDEDEKKKWNEKAKNAKVAAASEESGDE